MSSGIFGFGAGESVIKIYLKSEKEDNKYKYLNFGKNNTDEIKELHNDIISYISFLIYICCLLSGCVRTP